MAQDPLKTRLQISELDFEGIKNDLKAFLQGQDTFTDYDFEGSGLSVLIDLLAYNTHYSAFMANMIFNEGFLDTAVKRDSVVSRAKELGYTPNSYMAPTAIVTVKIIPNDAPISIIIPKNTKFTTSIDGVSYTFINLKDVIINAMDGVYSKSGIEIQEGILLSFSYTVDLSNTDQKFTIPNAGADLSSVNVTVKDSASSSSSSTWQVATDITEIDADKKVFWIDEATNGTYELMFGNGIIGKALEQGNVVTIEYLVTNGELANKASVFNVQSIAGYTNVTVTTEIASTGGSGIESIENIKFLAPRAYQAQNRGLTTEDIATILRKNYSNLNSIQVWGGEDNDPPIYGKVFIALDPKVGFFISSQAKQDIINTILKSRKVVGIIPEIVDPDYVYIGIDTEVKYNTNATTLSATAIQSLVQSTISNFFTSNLGKFDKSFRFSRLTKAIDAIGDYINNNVTTVKVQKRFTPTLNIIERHTFNFHVGIEPNSVRTTTFGVGSAQTQVVIKDLPSVLPADSNGTGILRLVNVATNEIIQTVGTINYASGLIDITTLEVTSLPTNSEIRFTCRPQVFDVPTVRERILILDDSTTDNVTKREAGVTITMTGEVDE